MSLPSYAEQSGRKKTRFVVQSSDVLAELKVNVMAENSTRVIWFKERFLEEEEIIEHFIHNETRRICWTMHRPRSGWYIRIRSPTFPPGAFIPLTPPPANTSHPTGSLLFSSRTNIPPTVDLEPRASTSSTADAHSYPPTPPVPPGPSITVQPPSPAAVQARLEQATAPRGAPSTQTQVTPFILSPHALDAAKPEQMTFFQRAVSAIKSQSAGPSYSFVLSRIPPPPPPPLRSTPAATASPTESTIALATPLAPESSRPSAPIAPVVTFHDRTPIMTVNQLTGLLELDQAEEQALGVDSTFWIAVALTYLEFLQERESYLAALSD